MLCAAIVSLLSGLSSGLLSTLLLQPLDVAKTSLINPQGRSSGMRELFAQIRRDAGWTGMWRGVGPALARISIVRCADATPIAAQRDFLAAAAHTFASLLSLIVQGSGVYFTTQTQLLSFLRHRAEAEGAAANAPLSSQSLLGVGFLSRASAVSTCCPISVVKTRIEGNAVRPYNGLFDGLSTIYRTEGVRGLYTGLLPSVLKDSPYSAVYLLLYSRLKQQFVVWEGGLHWLDGDSGPRRSAEELAGHPVIQFCSAFLAGGLATALFHPTEVIKTRLQLARLAPTSASLSAAAATPPVLPASRHRVLDMSVRIYREDGMAGFFRGLAPRIIKRSLSNACGWMIFEQLVQFWSGTTGL